MVEACSIICDAALFDVEWGITVDCMFKATPARRQTHGHMNKIDFNEGGSSWTTNLAGVWPMYSHRIYPNSSDPHLERGTGGQLNIPALMEKLYLRHRHGSRARTRMSFGQH